MDHKTGFIHPADLTVDIESEAFSANDYRFRKLMAGNFKFQGAGQHQSGKVERNLPSWQFPDHNQIQLPVCRISIRADGNSAADITTVGHRTDQVFAVRGSPVIGNLQIDRIKNPDCLQKSEKIGGQTAVLFLFVLLALKNG